jgi:hypothetical protein
METFEIGFQHITQSNGDILAFFISIFNKQRFLKTKIVVSTEEYFCILQK